MDRRLVAAVQAVLNLGGLSLKLDGVYGPLTRRAEESADPIISGLVRSVRAAYEEIAASRRIVGSPTAFARLISEIAETLGVPAAFAVRVAELESQLDPRAVSPSGKHHGFFQLGEAAITDLVRAGEIKHPQPSEVYDPVWSAQAGIRYLRMGARRLGLSITDPANWPAIYAAHNLGFWNAKKLMTGRYDKPLRQAIAAQANRLAAGGPNAYLSNVAKYLA